MKRILAILTLCLVLTLALTSCGENGKDGKDGLTPTIEISDDGYWVINGQKTNVKADGGNGEGAENPHGLDFYLNDDGTYAVAIGNAKYLSEIVIPETYLGKAVTEIAYNGFQGAQNLKSITIPDSVTNIGSYAFQSCDSLTSVVIPDSVTYIGDSAFESCSLLTSMVIGDSVTSIGDYAFFNCDGLTSVVIPDSVTTIGDAAFESCSSLTSVVIPDSVITIGYAAFRGCSSLTSVVISDGVTTIGEHAFYWCDSLKDVYYTGSEEEWKAIIGSSDYYLTIATIHYNYVPEE